MTPRFQTDQIQLFQTLAEVAERARTPVYLVGGLVRDLLLGCATADYDLDFMVVGDSRAIAQELCGRIGGTVKEFPKFLTAKIVAPKSVPSLQEIDLASARSETYPQPGKLPEVKPATSLKEDLLRRDFTINALAIPLVEFRLGIEQGGHDLQKLVVDQFTGLHDLETRTIRTLHAQSFKDDPTRLFRAARYAGRLAGQIEPTTQASFDDAIRADALTTISETRKLNELRKIIAEKDPLPALELLIMHGLFDRWRLFPDSHAAEILSEIKAIKERHLVPPEAEFDAVLAAFLRHFSEADGERRFMELGFGRKFIKRLRQNQKGDLS